MKNLILVALLLCLPLISFAQQQKPKERKLFSYDHSIDDFPNGLRLITLPTDYPNLVALYIVVGTGSRNEVEPGKSGYAHFFEHMMFRGSENFTSEQRDALLKRTGAEANAYTSDDRTVYHETFSKDDLDLVMKLEADRFLRLKYSPEDYRTESLAVLGEYNKNSASPFSKLIEVLRETAYKTHTYSHTTMGYLKDIKDMPNQYDYSLEFYKRWYRPENTTIVIVGDVTRERALALTKQYFGEWKKGTGDVPQIPTEPAQKEPRTAHIDWPSQALPMVVVAFRGPAYSEDSKDKVALDLLSPIAFGDNSDLYQKLVLKEQKVDYLGPSFDNQMDPELFAVLTRLKDQKDIEDVRQQLQATFERYTKELIPQKKLDETRSRIRYEFALKLDSSSAIASEIAPYIALRRSPETINKVFALMETVTPEDVRDAAKRYFTENNRTIVTLATKTPDKEAAK